jgi:hypothetical protein
MSVTVNVVGQTAVSVSVAASTGASVSVAASTGASVVASGGIGPAGFITVPGTSTQAFGTFQIAPGDGITVSTADGQFLISSYPSTTVSSLAPVQSVAGRTGAVVLQASDVTAGTFAIGRIPTIGYTALSGVPTAFTPASHTHDASAVASGTLSIARIPTISYTALSNTPATFTPSAHTHSTTDVVAFTAAAAAAAPVQSVAGRIGAISLTTADVGGLAAVASSGSYTSLQSIPANFAPQAHTHSTADITGFTGSFAAGNHTHDATAITSGVLDPARIPVIGYTALSGVPSSFAPAAHTHSLADLTQSSATTGQVATWNGTAWAAATPSPGGVTSVAGRTGTVTLAQLASSGTASSTTFLRGDGAWAAVSGASVVDGGTFVGVVPSITISQQPADVTISINQGSTGSASFSVAASSSTGTSVSYQWQRLVGSVWSYIDGAMSSTLTLAGLTGADDGASYRCLVNSLNAPELASNPASLAVSVIAPSAPVIAISSQPQAATILSTQSIASFSVSASATQSAAVTYQWQRRSAGSAIWQNVSSGTASTLSLTGLTYQQDNRSSYRCQINAQGASSVYSNTVDLEITWAAAPQITLASVSTATSLGSANYLFSTTQSFAFVTAADSIVGGTTVTYRWEISRYGRNNFSTQTFHSAAGSTTARTIRAYNSLIGSGSYDLRCVITATNSYGTTSVTTGVFSYSIISV